jgi:D-glycero-D-manno-heptose 1,7-bisphosphate phosphatase
VKAPEGRYIERPGELDLLPGVAEAVRLLNRADVWTGVVTNQRGVARGHMSGQDVEAVHERLACLLGQESAHLDAIYVCPHEAGTCDCRKPETGMLLEAQRELPGLDFSRAAIVGDSPSDIEAGRRLGLVTVLIVDAAEQPPAEVPVEAERLRADLVVADLLAAVQWILAK